VSAKISPLSIPSVDNLRKREGTPFHNYSGLTKINIAGGRSKFDGRGKIRSEGKGSFLLYVTKFVDLWNGRSSSSFLLSLQRKGGRDEQAEAHHQPIEPQ
jgi:hypothetical protein